MEKTQSAKIVPETVGDPDLEAQVVNAEKKLKVDEVRAKFILQILELVLGILALAILSPVVATSGSNTIFIILLAAACVVFLDGMRRVLVSTLSGTCILVCKGSNKVSDEEILKTIGVWPGNIMTEADRLRMKGFSSATAVNALQSIVTIGREPAVRKRQKRLLLADARIRLLHDLFAFYQAGSPDPDAIDCNGLITVMLDTMTDGNADSITLGEAKQFMQKIDTDGDMLLQRHEFLSFMLSFWIKESPLAQSNEYGAVDDIIYALHEKRVGILQKTKIGRDMDVITSAAGITAARATATDAPGCKNEVEKRIYDTEVIKDIFDWYDKQKTGGIDCNGLILLIKDIVSGQIDELSLAETKGFLEQVDEDGDMLLQSSELANYFLSGKWKETAPVAKNYETLGDFLKEKYPSYQKKLRQMWKELTGFEADDEPTHETNLDVKRLIDSLENSGDTNASAPPPPKSLAPMLEQKLSALMDALWEEYDTNKTSELTSSQLKSLVSETIGHEVPDDEIERFVYCMDTDRNASISQKEFHDFCATGLFMNEKQKTAYKARSAMHVHLVEFFSAIEKQLRSQNISNEENISFSKKKRKDFNPPTQRISTKGDVEVYAKKIQVPSSNLDIEIAAFEKDEEEAAKENTDLEETRHISVPQGKVENGDIEEVVKENVDTKTLQDTLVEEAEKLLSESQHEMVAGETGEK
jgi:Ca2+-binding EF-hand superfamily protein